MTRWLSSSILSSAGAIALATTAFSVSLLGSGAAIAQSTDPIDSLFDELGDRCNRATETSYRSQVLTAPDGETQAYTTGLLRKLVSPIQAASQTDSGYCFSSSRETLNRQIVITDRQGDRQITTPPYSSGYIINQPQSFSPDSKYLVVESHIGYTGGDAGGSIFFVNVLNGNIAENLQVCKSTTQDSYDQSYLGFLTPSEAVVACNAPAYQGHFEAINLQTGSVRRLASEPANLANYGTVESEFEVVQTQLFQ